MGTRYKIFAFSGSEPVSPWFRDLPGSVASGVSQVEGRTVAGQQLFADLRHRYLLLLA